MAKAEKQTETRDSLATRLETEPRELATIPTDDDVRSIVRSAADVFGGGLDGHRVEKMLALEEGQAISGTYVGLGGEATFVDEKTGEVRTCPTFRIAPDGAAAGLVVSLVGSTALARQMGGAKEGDHVMIGKGGLIQTKKGRIVRDFAVAIKSASHGDAE